jgi:hypothetical protein
MKKFTVISYDPDEQQTFWDRVNAPNKDRAHTMVADLRYYAIVVDVLDEAQVKGVATGLRVDTPADIADEWKRTRQCHR